MVGKSSTNNWGVVNDMVGGVGGSVSLNGHLGNMVNLMVDIVANMLDNRGSSNSNWSSVGNSNWGSSSISGNSGSSMGNSCNSRGGSSISGNSRGSMGNSSDSRGSYSVSSSVDSSYETMSKETMTIGTGNESSISISFSNWGSKATSNNSRENNLKQIMHYL